MDTVAIKMFNPEISVDLDCISQILSSLGVHHPTLLAMCLVASRQEVSKSLLGQTVPQADTLLTTLQYRFVCRKCRALQTLPKD